MSNYIPTQGAWLVTSLPQLSLRVVTEWRQCSALLASDSWYNELNVWSINADGSYLRSDHMESLSSNPGQAALRHSEIVERLVEGRELIDIDSEES